MAWASVRPTTARGADQVNVSRWWAYPLSRAFKYSWGVRINELRKCRFLDHLQGFLVYRCNVFAHHHSIVHLLCQAPAENCHRRKQRPGGRWGMEPNWGQPLPQVLNSLRRRPIRDNALVGNPDEPGIEGSLHDSHMSFTLDFGLCFGVQPFQ
jgi:hypothetical protein